MSTVALHSTLDISETVRDRGLVPDSRGPPIGNGIWAIKWSPDRWRHATPKVLWGSTVGCPSDSLASCFGNQDVTKAVFTVRTTSDGSAGCHDARCWTTPVGWTTQRHRTMSSGVVRCRPATSRANCRAVRVSHDVVSYDIVRCRTMPCAVWTPLKFSPIFGCTVCLRHDAVF